MKEGEPKYEEWEALGEAERLREKIISGEATSYAEAEKQLNLKQLLRVKEYLEISLRDFSAKNVSLQVLNDSAFFLEKTGLADLVNRVNLEIIPKAGIISIEKAIEELGPEIDEQCVERAMLVIGHETRKAERSNIGSEKFRLILARFLAETALVCGEFGRAKKYYETLGEPDKVDEMQKIMDFYPQEDDRRYGDDTYKTISEKYAIIRESCSKFMEAIKDAKEYNVDYEGLLREILQRVDEEISKIEKI